jgi:hypothetical protein
MHADPITDDLPLDPGPGPGPDEYAAPHTARALLDTAIEKADAESADGLFLVYVPVFGRKITMRRLSYAQITAVRRATDDLDEATRRMIHLSLVDPPFSRPEVDELLDNARLFQAATVINAAVQKINHLTEAEQAVVDARFRAGD